MYKLILFFSLVSLLSARTYTNCSMKNKDYEDICKKSVKSGVSYQYANHFILSYFKKGEEFDEVSWKSLQPNRIKHHKEQEKKANNALVKYVPLIVENLKKYKKVYDLAEKRYGVNREIIAAILLKETRLGKLKPTHDAFVVFNTMVLRTNPQSSREKWLHHMGKTNMSAIIRYCYTKGVEPRACKLPSSYAGAVGIPQFMPNSFIYAKGYRSKVADLTKMEDAILSVANFLHEKALFSVPLQWDIMPDVPKAESDWYAYAFTHKNASFVYEKNRYGKVYNCFTSSRPELEYMREYVKKIMYYNNSSNYAVGVIRLAYDAHFHP